MQPFMPPLRGSYFLFIPYPGFRPLRGSTPGLLYTTRASAGSYIRRAKPAEFINSSLGIRLPRRSKRAQRDAKPGAKRRSEPGRARVFLLLMSCGYCESPQKHQIHKASHSVGLRSVANAPALRARILGGSLPVVSSLRDSTTGYCLSPLSGLQIPLAIYSSTSDL